MANPWYDGANRDPGASAGYAHGVVHQMLSTVCHYTAGYNSRALIRDNGLAEFLVDRDGTVWQFCEANAICWQAGYPYNGRGPGIEIEYRDEDNIFTDAARESTSGLIHWLNREWGIRLEYYDDEAHPLADWEGFISHRSVIEDADHHEDYWPRSDWDLMVASPPTPMKGYGMSYAVSVSNTPPEWYVLEGGTYLGITAEQYVELTSKMPAFAIDGLQWYVLKSQCDRLQGIVHND